ncbi:tetratricopeptide repeat protein [Chryseobacterium arthrosphaerae]|uniref:Tetratricopeptide repeat protein n=1 Tax=Chryseobacterium arthrosphaerae TaxID=651561 RepID=A0ABU7R233_9FLAO|nr:tetratricopeptide repeat protein [Chryseobacterium arthrosphaerae]
MKLILLCLLCFTIIISCGPSEKDNDYFDSITNEVSLLRKENPEQIKKVYERELKKYKQSEKKIFLLSSKYVEMSLSADERLKQIPLVYELLRLNNNKYEYITIIGNYNLASQFELSSPDWSLKCIDKAIEYSEKTEKKYFLPHLYHFKGRLLYNKNDYKNALDYFNKALHSYDPQKDILYVSSMYNNIGMCYDKMKNLDKAISETYKAIDILEKNRNPNNGELIFINYMKGGLAEYFLQARDYQKAEDLLATKLNFSLHNNNYRMALYAAKKLIDLYKNILHEPEKTGKIIQSLEPIETNLKKPADRIELYELSQEYYSQKNDIENFKRISKKLVEANKERNRLIEKELKINFDIADNYIIKNINTENSYHKRNNMLLLFSVALLCFIFLIITTNLIRSRKKREELVKKEKVISANQHKILEQDIELQKEKIRNLHLNLNLKTETERAFLENLKKIKKAKNTDTEEVLKDLQFKINNLIMIDRKSNDLINESSLENKLFMERLSEKFPLLTSQELKLCVYFKLNLAAKEISLLENFTVGSIRVYKTKVKFKLGLDRENDLSEFLNKF